MVTSNNSIPNKSFDIPVLLVVFNRLDEVKKSIEAISRIKPKYFYVFSDGARAGNLDDISRIAAVRDYIENVVNWECHFDFYHSQENVGCDTAVSKGLDRLFQGHEYGIILEDDCVATIRFFKYCEILLKRYKHDTRIGMIAGTNHIHDETENLDYFFSRNYACWGWATWRRAWEFQDKSMNWRRSKENFDITRNIGFGIFSFVHYQICLRLIDRGNVEAWDWQWYFSLSAQNMLCIFPTTNLVENIGFSEMATHTSWRKEIYRVSLEASFSAEEITLPKKDLRCSRC
ncbi:hypothetical protein N9M77_05895 [Planktomarina temperata]|nr:hypothetical protein [Planktomarina temperata]